MRWASVLLFLVASLPTRASAETKGVLLDFSGWRAPRARSAALFGIAPHLEIVPRSEVKAVDGDLDEAVRELGITIVVRGAVRGRGRRARTTITIHDATGEVLAEGRAPGPRHARALRRIGRTASALLRRALERLPDEDVLDEPIGRRTVVRPEAAEPRTELEIANDELGLDPRIDEPAARIEERRAAIETKRPTPRVRAIEAVAEPPSTRSLVAALVGFTFRSRAARVGQSDQQNARHDSGVFPELSVGLRMTPFRPRSALGPAFLELEGHYALGVSSLERTSAVSSSAYRFLAQGGYLFDVSVLQVGAVVGVGHDAFTLGDNGVMGAARYTYLRIGGAARWAFADGFALVADGGLRPALSAGEIGSRYGQGAGAFGFDLAAGLVGGTDSGFSYGVSFGYTGYALRFGGAEDARTPVTATGGFDRSLAASVRVGWTL